MSPDEMYLVLAAYENYRKTGESYYSYVSPYYDDWFYAVTAARQLHQNGLIDSDLAYISNPSVTNLPGDIPPITFYILNDGIDKVRSEWNTER